MADDIVKNLRLNTTGFTGPAIASRKTFKEMTDSFKKEVADTDRRLREAAVARMKSLEQFGGAGNNGRLLSAVRGQHAAQQKELAIAREIAAAKKQAGIIPTEMSKRFQRSEEEQLARIPALLKTLAAEEVRTGQSRATQIERLIRLQERLTTSLKAQQAVVARSRLAVVGPPVATIENVRAAIDRVTAAYEAQGRTGGARLRQLLLMQGQLSAAEQRRADMVRRTQAAEAASWGRSHASSQSIAMARGGGGMGSKISQGLLEGSRAFEDASVMYQLQGMQGAVRGALNNVTALMVILGGPLVGAIGGVAAVLGSILIPKLMGAGSAFESAADKAKRLREEAEAVYEFAKKTGKVQVGLGDTDALMSQSQGLRENRESQAAFHKRLVGNTSEREGAVREIRGKVAAGRTELGDTDYAARKLRTQLQAFMESGNTDQVAETEQKLVELMKRRGEILARVTEDERQLVTAQRLLKEKLDEQVTAHVFGRTLRKTAAEFRGEREAKEQADRERSNGLKNVMLQTRNDANYWRDKRLRTEGIGALRDQTLQAVDPKKFEAVQIERERQERVKELDRLMPRRFQSFGGVRREVSNPERATIARQIDEAAERRRREIDPKREDSAANRSAQADSAEGIEAIVRATQSKDPQLVELKSIREQVGQAAAELKKQTRDARKRPVVARGRGN